jgi:hypothetical protein
MALPAFQVKVAATAPVFDEPVPTPDVVHAAITNSASDSTATLILSLFFTRRARGRASPLIDEFGSAMADASGCGRITTVAVINGHARRRTH